MKTIYILEGSPLSQFRFKLYTQIEAMLADPKNDLEITSRHFRRLRAAKMEEQKERLRLYQGQGTDTSNIRTDGYPVQVHGFTIYKEFVKR